MTNALTYLPLDSHKAFLPLRKIPRFYLLSWCGYFVERGSFCRISRELPKPLQKLCLFTTFPHQDIGWNFSILHNFTQCTIRKTSRPLPGHFHVASRKPSYYFLRQWKVVWRRLGLDFVIALGLDKKWIKDLVAVFSNHVFLECCNSNKIKVHGDSMQ